MWGCHKGARTGKGKPMSATTVAAPIRSAKPWSLTVRLALVAFAAVVLLAAAFVVGRTTAHSTVKRLPAISSTSTGSGADTACHLGRAC